MITDPDTICHHTTYAYRSTVLTGTPCGLATVETNRRTDTGHIYRTDRDCPAGHRHTVHRTA